MAASSRIGVFLPMAETSRALSIPPLVIDVALAHDAPMFVIHCDAHGSRVLLWPANIERIENGPAGPVLHWRCFCGARGRWSPDRRHRSEQAA
jgi:hypothetical protein